jgi:hypothetical protein
VTSSAPLTLARNTRLIALLVIGSILLFGTIGRNFGFAAACRSTMIRRGPGDYPSRRFSHWAAPL